MKKIFLKFFLAGGIIYWLVSSNKLDFSLIGKTLEKPQYFIVASLLISIQLLLCAYRFAFLLKIKSQKIIPNKLIGIQWIAQLFSTVLPGGFTSDLLKIGYVRDLDANLSRSFVLFAILIDRLIGLSSLLFISGIFSLLFFDHLVTLNLMMKKIIIINIILFSMSLVGMCFLLIKKKYQSVILKMIPTDKLKSLIQKVWSLEGFKWKFFLAYTISIGAHFLSIFSFWIINLPFFENEISLKYLATLIPLGQVAVALPISPGGIGVGHAAFATLFQFIHQSNGASLFNVYWVMLLIVNCFGIIPFVLKKRIGQK